MHRRAAAFTALVVVLAMCLGCLVGCGRTKSPWDAMREFAHLYPLPAGRMYDSTADISRAEYLPPELYAALYARPDQSDDREDVLRFALFLGTSPDYIYEMGVFECPDRDAAYEIVGIVRTRLAMLSSLEGADSSAVGDAAVMLFGSTVVYTVLPDNPKAARTWKRVL